MYNSHPDTAHLDRPVKTPAPHSRPRIQPTSRRPAANQTPPTDQGRNNRFLTALWRGVWEALKILLFGVPKPKRAGTWVFNPKDGTWRYYKDDWYWE
jgi:hypothetical protein